MSTQPLEVRINRTAIDGQTSNSYCAIMLNQKLTDAGFPMIGKLFVHGVRHGTFTMTVDNRAHEYVYTWNPDPDDEL
jgi:hypothetical protein